MANIQKLSENEQRLFCFYGFMGDSLTTQQKKLYIEKYGLTLRELSVTQHNLKNKGYLQSFFAWADEDGYKITPEMFSFACSILYSEKISWLNNFKNFKIKRSQRIAALNEIFEQGFSDKEISRASILLAIRGLDSYTFEQYFSAVLTDKRFENIFIACSPLCLTGTLKNYLTYFIGIDACAHPESSSIEYLVSLLRKNPMCKYLVDDITLDELYISDFIYYANIPKDLKKNSYAYCVITAIKMVYARKYDDAVKLFLLALKEKNKNSTLKNVFEDPILDYYLVLAYKMCDTDDCKQKCLQFCNKKFTNRTSKAPLFLAANYNVAETDENKLLVDYELLYKDSSSNEVRELSYLTGRLLALNDANVSLPFYDAAILKYELSCFGVKGVDVEKLKEVYGGDPIVGSVKIKSRWEVVLENLTRSLNPVADSLGDTYKNERIVYITNTTGNVTIKQQKRLKSGKWSKGSNVDYYRFTEGQLDSMDEADIRVKDNCRFNYWDGVTTEMDSIAPYLVGSDRVFMSKRTSDVIEPVTITSDKPFVSVEKTKDGFSFKSNVNLSGIHSYKRYLVKKNSTTSYTVIELDKRQFLFYSNLLSVKSFPKNAESQLKTFLPQISNIVEVHSDLVEGGSTLDSLDGSPILTLRVDSIDKDSCLINVYVKPLPDGNLEVFPGKGDEMVFDEKDGVRYQVMRKMKAEKKNLKLLNDFFEDSIEVADLGKDGNKQTVSLFFDELLDTLSFAQEHRDEMQVEWPEGEKIKLGAKMNSDNINFKLKSKAGWFEVEGDVKINDESTLTAAEFLELMRMAETRNYIKLNDTDFIQISESLRKQLARLEAMAQSGKGGKLIVSKFQVGGLAEVIRSDEFGLKTDKGYSDLLKQMKGADKLDPEVPATLKADLRDYQEVGFKWMVKRMEWGAGVCLADDMGLGKTLQSIALLLYKADAGASLVVAPASVVPNWRKEISRFAPTLNTFVLNTADNRKQVIAEAKQYDVVLCTYAMLWSEEEILTNKEWNAVCLDEAHTIKNRGTKMSAAAMKLQAKARVILTGTPIQNYLGELWNLFQFINPGLLGTFEQFGDKFINPIEVLHDTDKQKQLKRIVSPFMLRRTKSEVVEELPDKEEIVREVELSQSEMTAYELLRQTAEDSLKDADKVSMNTLAEITRLREAACSIELVDKNVSMSSSKLFELVNLTTEIVDGGNRVLVFSQFTSFLSLAAKELEKAKIKFEQLDGSTPMTKREKLVNAFQKGDFPVFLISLKAGGLGLNLTGANYVIHLDPWWNPAIQQQATDRAYRIGQDKKVTVYHLISSHTIEEKILRLHKTKRDLADSMMEGTDMSHKLTVEDMKELLKAVNE